MASPCIPTFNSKLKVITDVSGILSYIIDHYLTKPSGYLQVNANYERSLALDAVEFGYSAESITDKVKESLTTIITRYFPGNGTLNVEVSIVDNPDPTNIVDKEVKIAVSIDVSGQVYSVSKDTMLALKGS